MKMFLIHYEGVDPKCTKRKIEDYFFLERGSIGAVTRFINEAGEENTKGLKFDVYDVTTLDRKEIINRLDTLKPIKSYQFWEKAKLYKTRKRDFKNDIRKCVN